MYLYLQIAESVAHLHNSLELFFVTRSLYRPNLRDWHIKFGFGVDRDLRARTDVGVGCGARTLRLESQKHRPQVSSVKCQLFLRRGRNCGLEGPIALVESPSGALFPPNGQIRRESSICELGGVLEMVSCIAPG